LIICSTVKPACSPAIASLQTLAANEGLSMMLTPETGAEVRMTARNRLCPLSQLLGTYVSCRPPQG
jgi:hypothetical protein